MNSRLNPHAQCRVDECLQAPQHHVEHRPLRPWSRLILMVALTAAPGVISRLSSEPVL